MRVHGQAERVAWKSIEMAGTGFLQVVQIFAYLLYFKPKLLLIDEPDAHLHPGRQQLLIKSLELALTEFKETQVILTTHSSSLVRALSGNSTIHWMADGEVRAHGDVVRQRMGWNALDKDIVLFTEDGNTKYLQSIIDQWPEISNKCLLWPVFGKGSLPNGEKAEKISKAMGIKVMVYFDNDFMSAEDRAAWIAHKGYDKHNIPAWYPPISDVESFFCSAEYIQDVFEIESELANAIISDAVSQFKENEVMTEFSNAYSESVNSLKAIEGRNPISRWQELGEFGAGTIKGKDLLKSIGKSAPGVLSKNGLATKIRHRSKLGTCIKSHELGPDLKAKIEQII